MSDIERSKSDLLAEVKRLQSRIAEMVEADDRCAWEGSTFRRAGETCCEVLEAAECVPYRLRFGPELGSGTYEFVGAGFERLIGVPAEELSHELFMRLAKEVVVVEPDTPDDVPALAESFRRGEVAHLRAQYRIRTPQGGNVWLMDSSVPLRDGENGEVQGSLGLLQDITGLKGKERLAALGMTASALAHSIKNIQNNLMASTKLHEDALREKRWDKTVQTWPTVKKATDRIGCLVRDMLSIARPRKLSHDTFALAGLVQAVLDECRDRTEEKGVTLLAEPDPQTPLIRLDYSRLHDLLMNLVCNAAESFEFGGRRGGTVRVVTRAQPDGETFLIQVADDGPGIPADIQDQIFEPFFTTKGNRGTGLGLTVVKKEVEDLGGTLRVDSTVGEGTTFTVEIPLRR